MSPKYHKLIYNINELNKKYPKCQVMIHVKCIVVYTNISNIFSVTYLSCK